MLAEDEIDGKLTSVSVDVFGNGLTSNMMQSYTPLDSMMTSGRRTQVLPTPLTNRPLEGAVHMAEDRGETFITIPDRLVMPIQVIT